MTGATLHGHVRYKEIQAVGSLSGRAVCLIAVSPLSHPRRCLTDVLPLFHSCLTAVSLLSHRCLTDVSQLSRRCLTAVVPLSHSLSLSLSLSLSISLFLSLSLSRSLALSLSRSLSISRLFCRVSKWEGGVSPQAVTPLLNSPMGYVRLAAISSLEKIGTVRPQPEARTLKPNLPTSRKKSARLAIDPTFSPSPKL